MYPTHRLEGVESTNKKPRKFTNLFCITIICHWWWWWGPNSAVTFSECMSGLWHVSIVFLSICNFTMPENPCLSIIWLKIDKWPTSMDFHCCVHTNRLPIERSQIFYFTINWRIAQHRVGRVEHAWAEEKIRCSMECKRNFRNDSFKMDSRRAH